MSSPSPAVAAALQRWRSDPLDLSHRNPLLHLKPRRSCLLTISQPDPQAILEQLRAGKSWSFWLLTIEKDRQRGQPETNELVCADLDRAGLLHVLTGLYRQALMDYQELGLYLLHLALGVLEWRDDDGQIFRSPLVLLPVELARPSLHKPFRLTQADDALLNPALQARLLQDFDFRLPTFDSDDEKPLTTHLEEVRAAVAGLPGWQVESTALLTRFPFFKGVTHQDLLDNAQRMAEHSLVRALAGVLSSEPFASNVEVPDEHELDEVHPPEEAFHVLDADSSQRRCLEAARRGQSLVLLGPPGTGKSQTIANLIADCLARGKTVLFVSEKMAALDVVHQRLCQVGLGDFCLELHSHKAHKRAVIAELLRCLELPAELPPALPPANIERLRQYRQRLGAYVDALHRPREPLQQSVWWALGELARCHDLPALPLALPEGTELTAAWLEEARQALERARHLWHVRKDPDFPWRGFKLERYNLQLRDEVIGLIDKARVRLDRLLAVAQEYGRQLGVTGSVAWLLKLDELLEVTPKPPSQWLTADDLSELAADLDRCAANHQGQSAAQGPLMAKYGPGIWQLPEGTAAQLEETWRQVRLLLAPSDEAGADFLKLQQQLRGWAADTQRRVPGWLTEARTLEKWLGVPLPVGAAVSVAGAEALRSPDSGANRGFAGPAPVARADKFGPSLAALRRLLRLVNLCQSDTPPERAWVLDSAAREKAQNLIAQIRPDFTACRQGKAALLERYTEDFFDLDLERMGKAFDGFYRSFLRIFSASYRRDRRSIRRRTRTRTVLPTMADDVRAGRDLVVIQRRLEEQTAEWRPVLGRYEKGLDTDLDAAERAIKVAVEAFALIRQLDCETVPERLADALCAPGPPPEKVRAAARRLQDSLAAWWQHTQELRALLPLDLFPQVGQPLEEVALSALVHYGQQLQTALNRFAVLADPVLGRATAPPPDIATFLQDLQETERQRSAEINHPDRNYPPAGALRPWLPRLGTDWEALKKSLTWVQKLRGLFPGPLPEPVLRIATGAAPAPPSRELRTVRDQAQQAIHSLEIRFEPDERRGVSLLVEDQQQWLGLLRQRITDLADWSDWKLLQRRFEHLGLAVYWERLQQVEVPADRLADVFLKSALTHWLEPILREDPALAAFRRTDHERIVEEFREQDRLLIRQAAVHVAQQAEARRREAAGPELETERTLLLREVHNKGRPLPLRLLFEQIPGLLRRLKPCLLTNPLSVSQFFPAEIVFDLVIFDEASQIATEDAIGAICRGRQAMIVGDDKQLPPTSSFQQNLLDDEQEEAREASVLFESVLDACLKAGLPSYLLPCHYRSRHEGLIAYSNQSFYDGRLITFPAPSLSTSVELRHVPDGVYDYGGRHGNRREAEVVADLVFEHFQKYGDKKTLGVITFSQAQMTAIADEVERRLRDRPDLESFFTPDRLEGFFVKNLETAQGYERDVVLLSLGYGRDTDGRLTMHFGPISCEGGERWLNVAITRASERLVVVSSIRAADVDPALTRTAGLIHLRAYLEYVERGPAAPALVEKTLSALQRDLLAEVQRLGYEAEVQVGGSEYRLDVAVRAPGPDGRFVLGIETDGLSYQVAATVRDRDRLRPEALEKLGWRLYRVWSPAWVEHREEELAALRQAVERANQADS